MTDEPSKPISDPPPVMPYRAHDLQPDLSIVTFIVLPIVLVFGLLAYSLVGTFIARFMRVSGAATRGSDLIEWALVDGPVLVVSICLFALSALAVVKCVQHRWIVGGIVLPATYGLLWILFMFVMAIADDGLS